MTRRHLFVMALAFVAMIVAAVPADATTTQIYRVTFNTVYNLTTKLASQPWVLFQNPRDSGGSITINSVKFQLNDGDTPGTPPAPGVLRHDGEVECTVFSNITLGAGEGITIIVDAALEECLEVDCWSYSCATCPANDCWKMYIDYPPNGRICKCVAMPGGGSNMTPDRITVVIDVNDNSYKGPIVSGVNELVANADSVTAEVLTAFDVPVEESH